MTLIPVLYAAAILPYIFLSPSLNAKCTHHLHPIPACPLPWHSSQLSSPNSTFVMSSYFSLEFVLYQCICHCPTYYSSIYLFHIQEEDFKVIPYSSMLLLTPCTWFLDPTHSFIQWLNVNRATYIILCAPSGSELNPTKFYLSTNKVIDILVSCSFYFRRH